MKWEQKLEQLKKQNEELKKALAAKSTPKPQPEREKDAAAGPIPIVGEGEAIVINPAGSGGTRYLLVEIFLVRDDEKNAGFKPTIEAKSKELQAVTSNTLRRRTVEELSDPVVQNTIKDKLKALYQEIIGRYNRIGKLIVAKWIMQ